MRPSRAWAALAALVLVSVVLRSWAGLRLEGLWIAPDEMIYGSLGRSLWESGRLSVFGGPTALYSLVYPALAGLPLVLFELERGYEVLKVLQALVMSLAAVPAFLWARRLAGERWALVAAALTLAPAGLLYAGMIMTEVAFYPVMALTAWALAAALERPTGARQALLAAAVVLAVATRLQALVLPAVVLSAVVLDAALAREPRRVLRFWPAGAALAALGVAWLAWRGSLSGALGSYAAATESGYELGDSLRFVAWHLADVLLLTALFPACAAALLVWEVVRGREREAAVRAYAAAVVPLVAWTVAEVGVFASANVGRLAERDLLGLAPALFVGFAAWLGRGAPRPRVAAYAVGLAAAGLLLALPLRRFVVQEAVVDAFTLVPLLWLRERAAESTFELVVWLGVAALILVFALVPRGLVVVLPALALAALLGASAAASREVAQNVSFDQRNYLGGERGWVDRAAEEPVAYVYAGSRYWNGVWQQLFWNREIERVYVLPGIRPPTGMPATELVVAPDGELRVEGRRVPERLLVATDAVALAGEAVASVRQRFLEETGLTLWRLDGAPRLSTLRRGVRENGDMHEPAQLVAWDCAGGRLELTLLPKAATRVELRANGVVQNVLQVAGEEFVNATVFAPPGARVCRFEVVPDSTLGSTRFEFVRP